MDRGLVKLLNTTIQLAVFDIDQTLMDTEERNDDAVTQYIGLLNLPADQKLKRFILSHSALQVAEGISLLLGKTITTKEVETRYIECYHASTVPIRVHPQTMPIIHSLKERGIKVATITSASPPIIFYNLTALQISYQAYAGKDRLFDAVAYAEEGLPHKPDPAVNNLLQRRLGRYFAAETILVIGDSVETDGQLAQNIGAWFQHINQKYTLSTLYKELKKGKFIVPRPMIEE